MTQLSKRSLIKTAGWAALAAAVRGEQALSVTLDEELVIQETLLRVSDML